MPLGFQNLEFLNLNAQRRYPLAEDADGVDDTGSVTLPSDFLVAMDLPIHYALNVDLTRFFVRYVGIYATGFSVIVGYQPTVGDPVNVASAMIPRDGFATNTTVVLGGVDDYVDTIGKLTVGNADTIGEQPNGFFTFSLAHTRIEPDCLRPMLRGITSITVVNGTETSERLYGDIELVAEDNMQLVTVIEEGEDPKILISAISGEGLAEDCVCDGDDAVPIRRINGIPPTPDGDFSLLGSSCLTVTAVNNGLQLKDICSEPCCGCAELETLTRTLEGFGSQATTLENFLNRLEAKVTTMDEIVLGSKLSDQGCLAT